MRNLSFRLTLLVLFIFTSCVYAQKKASTPVAAPKKAFKLFFEKVYLHTDREYYATGDDIWFKAYFVNGESNYETYSSNNLYVDLITPDSKILTREIIRLDSGRGVGDFKLTDSIPGGTYHLRAYTNWMRNFGDNFIFDKTLTINSTIGIKPGATNAQSSKAAKIAVSKLPVAIPNEDRISFFPEGGSMVEGVPCIIGFKAIDGMGKGIKAGGSIVSSAGDTVGHFESTGAGLGSFTLMPNSGVKYSVKGFYRNNKPFTAELPTALSQGYALHINNSDSSFVQVVLSTNQPMLDLHKGKQLTIAAKHSDRIYFSGKFTLNDLQTAINIPKNQLPAGVASVILYDEQLHPNNERLVYINNANPVKLSITTDKSSYDSKGQTTVTIKAVDAKNNPVKADLSLAAVDASVVPADDGNIVSYLMLQSEVRGKIENAAQYFDPANANRFKQIDILLMTQGWRDFVWKRLADSTLKLSYLPEGGFTVSGRLRQVLFNRPIPNMNITMFAPGAKGNKMFIAKTDSAGRYFLDGIELYGSQTLKISAKDNKGNKTGWLFLDTIGSNPLVVKPQPIIAPELTEQLAAFNAASVQRRKTANLFKTANGVQLKEVNIREAPKTIVSRSGEILTSFGYPEYDFDITQKDYAYRDLEDYLIHKVPGAQANTDTSSGVVFYFGGKKVFPRFYVEKQEDVFERIDYYVLTMDQINSVVERHMVTPGGGDVILIYLNLKPSAFQKKEFNLINSDVNGYYSARTFYAPNYESPSSKADPRTTIHWEPSVATDATGVATISFFNADPKSKIRVVVEGITDKGVPVTATAAYTVK